jgi:Acyl-CoA reductase (LuxC)
VTHSKLIDSKVEFCCPKDGLIDSLLVTNSQEVYSQKVIKFLKELAEIILIDREARKFPDVIAFAFWCRDIDERVHLGTSNYRRGRGLVFHVTPGNVPVNFAYSLATGLLSGNVNIVRLPSKKFEQVEYLIVKIGALISKPTHREVRNYFALVRYPKEREINDYFSELCDVRVIWGGNQTIHEIRKSNISAKTFDITFPDRYSICVVNSERYLKSNEKVKIAQGFYNDTYLFDQNACTAPHLISWIGDAKLCSEASKIFWKNLEPIVSKRYSIEPLQIMDKLVMSARFSSGHPLAKLRRSGDNKIFRIQLKEIKLNLEEFKSHSGLFYEVALQKLEELVEAVTGNYQTMVYYGFKYEELRQFIESSNLRGIDRIVPIGKSLAFSLNWDGYNLIESLSRSVEILKDES